MKGLRNEGPFRQRMRLAANGNWKQKVAVRRHDAKVTTTAMPALDKQLMGVAQKNPFQSNFTSFNAFN